MRCKRATGDGGEERTGAGHELAGGSRGWVQVRAGKQQKRLEGARLVTAARCGRCLAWLWLCCDAAGLARAPLSQWAAVGPGASCTPPTAAAANYRPLVLPRLSALRRSRATEPFTLSHACPAPASNHLHALVASPAAAALQPVSRPHHLHLRRLLRHRARPPSCFAVVVCPPCPANHVRQTLSQGRRGLPVLCECLAHPYVLFPCPRPRPPSSTDARQLSTPSSRPGSAWKRPASSTSRSVLGTPLYSNHSCKTSKPTLHTLRLCNWPPRSADWEAVSSRLEALHCKIPG